MYLKYLFSISLIGICTTNVLASDQEMYFNIVDVTHGVHVKSFKEYRFSERLFRVNISQHEEGFAKSLLVDNLSNESPFRGCGDLDTKIYSQSSPKFYRFSRIDPIKVKNLTSGTWKDFETKNDKNIPALVFTDESTSTLVFCSEGVWYLQTID